MMPAMASMLIDGVPLPSEGAAGRLSDDQMLERFLEWTMEQGFELYDHQEEAVLEIMAGRHVILNTPTGSGKSLVALAMHFRALAQGKRAYYTCPIKALVSEKFFDLCRVLGPERVGMLTGDAALNHDAPIICCTAEVLANLALREGDQAKVDYAIVDEFHYFADRDRGIAWQIPLLTLPQTTFMLMSATLGDTDPFEKELHQRSGREVSVVRSDQRPVPLEFSYSETPIHETIEEIVEGQRSPVYVVNFTQREAAELAQALTSIKLIDRDRRQKILDAIRGVRFDSVYGKDIQRFIKAGVGLHHAGLLPKYRLLIERLAQEGLLEVICGTDTLGVGVNVPIRTVLFSKLCKYDGESTKILAVRDFKQIAGRAGRKGYDDRGWVLAQAPAHVIENMKLEAKARGAAKPGKKPKKFVRKKPPERGYVHWDQKTFEKLEGGQPATLRAAFRVDHGMMLNMLQRPSAQARPDGGYADLLALIEESGERAVIVRKLKREAAQLFRALRGAGIVTLVPRDPANPGNPAKGARVQIADSLQRDFSLLQTLGLYLVETLEKLPSPEEDELHPLHVISLAEAILENPRVILMMQEKKARSEKVAALKAEGVEYEQRMEALEQVSYPKPDADFIYDTFNAFCREHPWVGGENIRPKSIVRDMYERWATFNDYVKLYGLSRSEGVLLRHLHQTYKVLAQTVPEAHKTPAVVDAIAWLRATIERVDSSLVQEWERMLSGAPDLDEEIQEKLEAMRPEPSDISLDAKEFRARIRAELHQLVHALSRKDWDEALASIRAMPDEAGEDWTEARLEAALGPYYEQYPSLEFGPRARQTDKTLITEAEDHLWTVRQTLVDPEDEGFWYIEGEVDLREDRSPEGPLVRVLRVAS
ncbi:DEAD/DEAH box helicase [Plesiocystis pacifica SIR-1]|uniref:DEAD/DEAH box helicase n=2 Tax=Plesiocystis pacifica TaxID=191768 RepID=A6GDC0_9BACT|nr:DEAD/DEAH box helicase [Plesiocystis pacifica SIR-1]